MSSEEIKKWELPEFSLSSSIRNNIQKNNEKKYDDGFEKGYQAGLKKAELENKKKSEMIANIFSELEKIKNQFNEKIDHEVRKQAFLFLQLACEKIIFDKLEKTKEIILKTLDSAFSLIEKKEQKIKIVSSEKSKEIISSYQDINKIQILSFEIDSNIPEFGFLIKYDDFQLEFNVKDAVEKFSDEYSKQAS